MARYRSDVRSDGAESDDARAEWLVGAQAGDALAFAALYRDLQPRLLRYATGLVGQDAEDVTAEAWLQIARDLKRFQGDAQAFRGWATRIVRNRAIDHGRARTRRPVVVTDRTDLLDRPVAQETTAIVEEQMSTAEAIARIGGLPRDQAEAILLRVVVGLDAVTAGQVVGKRAGAIRVAAHRGLKTLAAQLDAESTADTMAGHD